MKLRIDIVFKDWEDPDVAMYLVGCLLGLMKFDASFDEFRRTKGVYNTRNEIADLLYKFLEHLVEVRILIKNDDFQYKWNVEFDAYWLNEEIRSSKLARDNAN